MFYNRKAAIGVPSLIRSKKLSRLITVAILSCASLFNTHLPEVSAQDLALKGVANFRDIGGYSTTGGKKIKSGVIFRSGELSGLTPADQKALAGLNIRYEVDLRNEAERAANPSNWGEKVPQLIWISVMQPNTSVQTSMQKFAEVKDAAGAKMVMAQATANIAVTGAASIGKVLGELAKADGPSLIHCSAGKDRTGVTVAVLMTLLGASHEDVYHEYLRSNESIDAQMQRAQAREQAGKEVNGLSGISRVVVRTMMGTDPSYLDAMFRQINEKYGSFDSYTQRGLGITATQIAQLRKKLIEQ